MRVALIRTFQPMLVEEIAHPLGILSLDAYLRERGFHDVHLFDMRLRRETPEQILARVLPLRPDVIGLSALTIERDNVHALARLIKKLAPHVVTVLGGPYPTSSGQSVMKDESVDCAVIGEGEITFHELLVALREKRDLSTVSGILFRDGERVVETPDRPTIADLDELPMPSWDRVDFAEYDKDPNLERFTAGRWAAIATSRGCPFKCTYCHDVFGKRFRARSPQKVIEEMELLIERHGVRSFLFYEDIFNFQRKRVLEIVAA